MIESISFNNVNPKVFDDAPVGASSMVWNRSVTFHKGKSYLIEAGSGTGKSSFCSFLCGLRSDFTGDIVYNFSSDVAMSHKNCDFVPLRRESIAVMFQDLKLFPELTAIDNVMLKSRLTGYTTEKEIKDMLIRLGLGDRLGVPCCRLSFGQQQRVAFVRAMSQPCDFILLDEPVSHLDVVNSGIMSDILRERQQKDGVGVIVTSIGYRMLYEYDKIMNL